MKDDSTSLYLADRLQDRIDKLLKEISRCISDHSHRETDRKALYTWPKNTPIPPTLGHSFNWLVQNTEELINGTVASIEYCANFLVNKELYRAVISRRFVTDRWPWTIDLPTTEMLIFLLETLEVQNKIAIEELHRTRGYWPGEAAPLDVALWAQDSLNAIDDRKRGDSLVLHAKEGFPYGAFHKRKKIGQSNQYWIYLGDFKERKIYPFSGMALLYLTERSVKAVTPTPPQITLMAVDRAPIRTMTSLSGADPRDLVNGAHLYEDKSPDQPTSLEFTWPDREQLELPFLPPGTGALVAVQHKYGPAAVRDLLAIYLFTWASRARANETIWWWPDEHLEMVNRKQSKELRNSLLSRLHNLHESRLTAHYADGTPIRGPILASIETDGSAHLIRLHTALYRGICREDGTPGNRWWPIPIELLQLPADGTKGRVHILAPVLGYLWRGALPASKGIPEAKIGSERLATYLAIHLRDETRKRDPRAGKQLEETLRAGKLCGLVKDWRVERGKLDNLTGVIYATPGPLIQNILTTGEIPRPERLPATGEDLAKWMEIADYGSKDAGLFLDIPASTIRRVCSTHWGRPLPVKVRQALRHALWKPMTG